MLTAHQRSYCECINMGAQGPVAEMVRFTYLASHYEPPMHHTEGQESMTSYLVLSFIER